MNTVDLERLKEKEDAAIKIIDSWPRIFQLLIQRQLYAFGTRISNIDSEIEKETEEARLKLYFLCGKNKRNSFAQSNCLYEKSALLS